MKALLSPLILKSRVMVKGSLTGNFSDPQRTVCSKMWATPFELSGNVLTRIFHETLGKSALLFPDSFEEALIQKGLKTFPARPCLATRKTF